MTRQAANLEILRKITNNVNKYPDMRFHQLLQAMDIEQIDTRINLCVIDEYYTESEEVLKRIK